MIRVLACRGFERRRVDSVGGRPVQIESPIGLVEYQGEGTVGKTEVSINSYEEVGFGKRKMIPRTIPLTHCVKVEVLGS